jgi:hypothetical protein
MSKLRKVNPTKEYICQLCHHVGLNRRTYLPVYCILWIRRKIPHSFPNKVLAHLPKSKNIWTSTLLRTVLDRTHQTEIKCLRKTMQPLIISQLSLVWRNQTGNTNKEINKGINQTVEVCWARRPWATEPQPHYPYHRQMKTIVIQQQRRLPCFGDLSILMLSILEMLLR